MGEIKKACPQAGRRQADTINHRNYDSTDSLDSQEKSLAWTMYDQSLRTGMMNPERWNCKTLDEYKINILHPELKPIYERYQEIVCGRRIYPMSDNQRFEFERMVFSVLALFDRCKEEKIRLLKEEIEKIPVNPFWVRVGYEGKYLEPERFHR